MAHLPPDPSDADLVSYADRWPSLLEAEDYRAAFNFTTHDPEMRWSPERMREVIKSYGDAAPAQRVTLDGQPTDIIQRKNVDRWPLTEHGALGEIWYDLNIDGFASDLTATLTMIGRSDGIDIQLNDIHVM